MLKNHMNQEVQDKIARLTPLKKAVLLKLLEGYSDEEIAEAAKIRNRSVNAVKKHIQVIAEHLELRKPGDSRRSHREEIRRLVKPEDVRAVMGADEPAIARPAAKVPLRHLAGVVPLDSSLYVERDADKTCREILQTVANTEDTRPFIRLRASQGLGKSSLLLRLRQALEKDSDRIVGLVDLGNSERFDSEVLSDLDRLLREFTRAIGDTFSESVADLALPDLDEYWTGTKNKNMAPGLKCSTYLSEYIFSKIQGVKVLLIDGIDRVLGKKPKQNPFLDLLRSWNERKMKKVSKAPIIWPSLAIAYSTEPYPEYGIQGSVLQNVGMVVELPEFSPEQVQDLATRYGLSLSGEDVNSLIELIGGHPTLINDALYKMNREDIRPLEIEAQATLLSGPFGDYLLQKFKPLRDDRRLSDCFGKTIEGEPVNDEFAKFQLLKAGLIAIEGNAVICKLEIYRKYYQENLAGSPTDLGVVDE